MWKVPEENQIEIRIALIQHEGYDSHIITNDVSVLKLDEPLEFNEWANSSSFAVKWWKFSRYVQPLPLAPKGDDPAGGTICINSGHQKPQCVFCDVQNQETDKSEIPTHRLGIHQSQLSGSNAKQVAGKKCSVFYRTRVRWLGMLVSDSLTHWLTNWLTPV